MNDSTLNRLLREVFEACEADVRFKNATDTAKEIEAAAIAFPTAIAAWHRDRAAAPTHAWPDSTKELLVHQALANALRYTILAKALVHEAHGEARKSTRD